MTGEHVTVDRVLEAMPYARFLGVEPRWDGDGFTLVLPFAPHLIGNTRLPALHGGVLGALLELAALAQITLAEPRDRLPRTIDVTIEYLKPGRPETTFAAAKIRRVGRRIANVQAEAWQRARDEPVAALRGHFMLGVVPARG